MRFSRFPVRSSPTYGSPDKPRLGHVRGELTITAGMSRCAQCDNERRVSKQQLLE